MSSFMMVAKAELPEGTAGYGPEGVEELRARVDLLTEPELGGVAAECGALRHLVADEETKPIPGREGWVETSYSLVAGGAEEVREYLARALDEVVGEHPHPNVSYEGFGGRTYAVSGGISDGDDPTLGRDGSEAYSWVQALDASGVLAAPPSGTAPEEIEGILGRARGGRGGEASLRGFALARLRGPGRRGPGDRLVGPPAARRGARAAGARPGGGPGVVRRFWPRAGRGVRLMAAKRTPLPPGFRRIKGLVHFQNDTSDIELETAKEQARELREEKGEDGRPRYLGAEVVNKAPERRDGRIVRFGRVFVARREDNPGAG